MKLIRISLQLFFVLILTSVVLAQTADSKTFAKDGISFDYPAGWTSQEDSNADAQQFLLARTDSEAQVRIFVHRGKISSEKLPDARKAFIDPYISAMSKQFVAMGATPKQVPDATEIGGAKAEGVILTASIGGDPGAARIYWVLLGQRVVMMTYFGPDRDLKKSLPAWDLVRTSFKVNTPQANPKSSPKP